MTVPGNQLVYRYACCVHCDPDPDDGERRSHIDGHTIPCPHGCNDGEGEAAT